MAKSNKEIAHTQRVLVDIDFEREKQDIKFGGVNHDDQHSTMDFIDFMKIKTGESLVAEINDDHKEARRRMIQVAALAVACVERMDRAQDYLADDLEKAGI